MKHNKYSLLILITPLLLVGCTTNEYKGEMETKIIPFNELSGGYDIDDTNIKTYFPNGSSIPYIDVSDTISSLDGLFDSGSISVTLNTLVNTFTVTKYYQGYPYYKMYINYANDTIKMNDFDMINSLLKSISTTSYNSYLTLKDYQFDETSGITFSLKDYGFDILYYQKKCLMPLFIFNTIFLSPNMYNLFYNGEEYYGYYGEISTSDEYYELIYKSNLNNMTQTVEEREYAYNSLCFVFDYYYGLKEDKKITKTSDYISKDNQALLKSTNANDNNIGLKQFILHDIDELHSRVDTLSMYSEYDNTFPYYLDECGDRWKSYYSLRSTLQEYRGELSNDVRIKDDTAIITLNSFKTGSNKYLYDEDGNVLDTAYLYDSYFQMKHDLEIINNYKDVKNVIIDISLNGGGNIGAMIRVLGYLTNNNISLHYKDLINSQNQMISYHVDISNSINTNYKYYILTSGNSFSAANFFTSIAKDMGIATIVGQTTGGGMCSVIPLVLGDGSAITISSYNTTRNNKYGSIEYGITPDIVIPYSDFYNKESPMTSPIHFE